MIPYATPSLEVIKTQLVDQPQQVQHAVHIFWLAETVLNQKDVLLRAHPSSGKLAITVPHAAQNNVLLSVEAQKAPRISNCTQLIFATLKVQDPRGEMSFFVERRKINHYDLSDDPFINQVTGYFQSHSEHLIASTP